MPKTPLIEPDDITKYVVRFARGHPHAGELGRFTGKRITTPTGTVMYEFDLIDCEHGVEACFAQKGQATIDRDAMRRLHDA